mgnify:CR=1 FL=1
MDKKFTVEESNLICIFAGESRTEVIKDISRARNFNPNLPLNIAGSDLLSMALQRVLDVEYLIGGEGA